MEHSEDWVPRGLAEFKVFADTFCSEVATNKVAWGLDVTDAAAIVGEHTTFNDDYCFTPIFIYCNSHRSNHQRNQHSVSPCQLMPIRKWHLLPLA